MGETLARPVTQPHCTTIELDVATLSACSVQGWRKRLEDAHCLEYGIMSERSNPLQSHIFSSRKDSQDGQDRSQRCPEDSTPPATYLFAAVFDGHNGVSVAKECSLSLFSKFIATHPIFLQEFSTREDIAVKAHATTATPDYAKCLYDAHLSMDAMLRETSLFDDSGATALSVLIIANTIYCANVGDCRAVASRRGGSVVQPLSHDHKPTDFVEMQRIRAARGLVERGRVNGILAVSRALGDFSFKNATNLQPEKQMVSACPEISVYPLGEDLDFILLACDGVWEVLSSKEAVCYMHQMLQTHNNDPSLALEGLIQHCIAPTPHGPGTDNMTACLILPHTLELVAQHSQYPIPVESTYNTTSVSSYV